LKDLYKRSLTGIVLVGLLYGALFAGPLTFYLFFSLLNVIGLWEFYNMVKRPEWKPQRYVGIVSGLVTITVFYLAASGRVRMELLFVLIPVIFFVFLFELFRKTSFPIVNVGFTLFAILYISVPLSMLSFMAFVPAAGGECL
jgi:phosphatidate cytidylyltransferase